jgi:hypothetical protein
LSSANNGYSPALALANDGTLLLGALLRNGDEAEATVHACSASGSACAKVLRTQAQDLSLSAWPARGSFALAGRAQKRLASLQFERASLTLAVCANGASSCTPSNTAMGRQETGYQAIALPDKAGDALAVAHLSGSRSVMEPLLTVCGPGGTGCTVRELLTETGLPLRTHLGLDAKRTEGDDVLVSTIADGRVRLFRCNSVKSGCDVRDLGPAPSVPTDLFSGTSLLPTATGVDVLVGAADGIQRFECTLGLACTRKDDIVRLRRPLAPYWLSSVRVPDDDTVYATAAIATSGVVPPRGRYEPSAWISATRPRESPAMTLSPESAMSVMGATISLP